MLVGYARVSSQGQKLDIQEEALRAAGCTEIYSEKKSGRDAKSRTALRDALHFVRKGDTLVVTRLDRLARSVADLLQVLETLAEQGVSFRCLQQPSVDTDSSSGRLMLTILGAVAAFEADIRKERQMEGIEKAKAAGVYKGRKPTIDKEKIRELHSGGMGATQIAKELRIARASVYRAIA